MCAQTPANFHFRSSRIAPIRHDVWDQFQRDLALCLTDLGEEEFLILSHQQVNYFVQFAGEGFSGMRAEAASNAFIDDEAALTSDGYQAMRSLGWQMPTHLPEDEAEFGSPNFYLDLPHPVDFDQLAALATNTLRQVFLVKLPEELEYLAFHDDGDSIRFPTLRVRRRTE